MLCTRFGGCLERDPVLLEDGKVAALEAAGARSYAEFGELISGVRTRQLAYREGQADRGMLSLGPAVGFARAIEPAAVIVARLQQQFVDAARRFVQHVQ